MTLACRNRGSPPSGLSCGDGTDSAMDSSRLTTPFRTCSRRGRSMQKPLPDIGGSMWAEGGWYTQERRWGEGSYWRRGPNRGRRLLGWRSKHGAETRCVRHIVRVNCEWRIRFPNASYPRMDMLSQDETRGRCTSTRPTPTG